MRLSLDLHSMHTSLKKDVSSVDIDAYLNRAKDTILERYDELVEKNRTLENHLRVLEIHNKSLLLLQKTKDYNLYALPDNYYNYLRVIGSACGGDCEIPDELLDIQYTQKDDLNESLRDPFRTPNWYWRRGIVNFVNEGLQFYHKGEYDVKDIKLSYIKHIPDVAAVTLCKGGDKILSSDGVTVLTSNRDLMLPRTGTLWRKIVQLAVFYIRKSIDDNYKADMDSILFSENLQIV